MQRRSRWAPTIAAITGRSEVRRWSSCCNGIQHVLHQPIAHRSHFRKRTQKRPSRSLHSTMPVTITRHVAINIGGKYDWRVKPSNLLDIDGAEYIKLSASDYGFVKLVCDGIVEPLAKNASLSSCEGVKELLRLRNAKQREELAEPTSAAAGLFGEAEAKPIKRLRGAGSSARVLRQAPSVLTLSIPGDGGEGDVDVSVVRPVHIRDDLCVALDPLTIERIVRFIRERGISSDEVNGTKRRYKSSGADAPKGIWCTDNGFVVKFQRGVGEEESEAAPKYRRVKTIDEAIRVLEDETLAPLADSGDTGMPAPLPDGVPDVVPIGDAPN